MPNLSHVCASLRLGYLGAPPSLPAPHGGEQLGLNPLYLWHSHSDLAPVCGCPPRFLLFDFGLYGPLGLSAASFRRTLRLRSHAIYAQFYSGHALPRVCPKYFSSPVSQLGRAAQVDRPVGYYKFSDISF